MKHNNNSYLDTELNSTNETIILDQTKINLPQLRPLEKDYIIMNYFTENKHNTKTMICRISTCNAEIINKKHNLCRHFITKHGNYLENLKNSKDSIPKAIAAKNMFLEKDCKEIKIDSFMSKNMFINSILDIVLGGCSFNILNNQGFRRLTYGFCAAFDTKINSHNIKNILDEKYNMVKSDIISKFCNMPLTLKLDGAQRHMKYFLGVNVQCCYDFKVCIYNLGVVEVQTTTTAINLNDKLLELLNEFNININQIFCITTDNARNYLKISKLLHTTISHVLQEQMDNDNSFIDFLDDNINNENDVFSTSSIMELLSHCQTVLGLIASYIYLYVSYE